MMAHHRPPLPVMPPGRPVRRAAQIAASALAWSLLMATSLTSAATVQVATVRLQSSGDAGSLEWEARIEATRQSTVAAQVPGNLTALLVKAGDAVKAGQALARIDAREAQATLNRGEAEVAQAQAQLTHARLQWERTRSLKSDGFVSAAALDSAQAQLQAAQAAVAAAQAARSQAALAQSFTTVTAPFEGKVLATHAEVGDLAAPGRPILTLYAPQPLRAVVQIPASQAEAVRSAQSIEVSLPQAAGLSSASAVAAWVKPTRIVSLPGADPVSQTVEWRLDLPAVNALPGQTTRVRFAGMPRQASAQATGWTVPAAAIAQRGELTGVYVVREGRFVLQAVRTGPMTEGSTQARLLSGVRPGDVIATDAIRAGLADAKPAQP
ncbi:MAG: efflux RND transporter periplasmic adaptor subunit [Aquabacterium sp.]